MLFVSAGFSAVKSNSGVIDFDINADNMYEAHLNSNGLGIGVVPTANLHVAGNSVVSGTLSVGGISSKNTLNVEGTMGYSIATMTNGSVLDQASVYLADTSSSSLTAHLPSASSVSGRVITIKRTDVKNYIFLYTSDNNSWIDGERALTLAPMAPGSSLSYVKLVSGGGNWHIIDSTNNGDISKGVGKVLHRSSGYGNTSALASGNGSHLLTIINGKATFTGTTLAGNIGVGDAVQYDANGNGSVDSIAFISQRVSSTEYHLQSAVGEMPSDVSNDGDWSIFRAYKGLHYWQLAQENSAIAASVIDFDGQGVDLISGNSVMHIALYADASDDLGAIGYIGPSLFNYANKTSGRNYIKFYAPHQNSEVGVSQRHSGVWDDSKFNIASSKSYGLFRLGQSGIRIEGLQISATTTSTISYIVECAGINDVSSDIRIGHNIMRRVGAVGENIKAVFVNTLTSSDVKIYNNIIYGFGMGIHVNGGTSEGSYAIYNNTTTKNTYGIRHGYNGTSVISIYKNNLSTANTTDDYKFASGNQPGEGVTASHNFSGDTSANLEGLGTGSTTFTFVDAAGNDYHLSTSDTGASYKGVDLSNDAMFSFSEDIDSATRVGVWSVGADQN